MNELFVYLHFNSLLDIIKSDMKVNEEYDIHLGKNVKHLMRAFQLTQSQLAEKLGMPDSHVSNLLQKADIDDNTLQRIADVIGNGVTPDMIKAYSHDDTISYIINNYTQNVENGGNGTLIPKQDNSSTFQEGSQPTINHYVAEQVFALVEKNTKLEKLLLYYRMKTEPDLVEKEMESLKNDYKTE